MDPEIKAHIDQFAESHGLTVTIKHADRVAPTYRISGPEFGTDKLRGKSRNPIRTALKQLGVFGNKHIPECYMLNDRETRMSLLAGLIDTDGSLTSNCYVLSSKWNGFADQVSRLAQSLGFRTSVVKTSANCQSGEFTAFRVTISGDGLDQLPVKIARKKAVPRQQAKNALVSGIAVRPVGEGDYFGFELDGDGLFLLEDFTVTHNSPYVVEFAKLLLESGEPIVLWGWHRAVYEIWMEGLAAFQPAMYTGSESATQKDESIRRFTSGETKVLIMSLRSGAGVDGLQGYCHTGVFGELDWSPAMHEQCAGRLHRDGQEDPCTVYFLLSDTGADPFIAEVLGIKRDQIEGVRNPDMALAERIDTGENSLRRLARDLLIRRGETLPEVPSVTPIASVTPAAEPAAADTLVSS